jgi:hypothetical protein
MLELRKRISSFLQLDRARKMRQNDMPQRNCIICGEASVSFQAVNRPYSSMWCKECLSKEHFAWYMVYVLEEIVLC